MPDKVRGKSCAYSGRSYPAQYGHKHFHEVQCVQGGDFMAFSIRLTDDERMLAESNAKLHSYSLSEAFKRPKDFRNILRPLFCINETAKAMSFSLTFIV